MSEKGLLTICVVCGADIARIEDWGKRVCVAMDKEAEGLPESLRPFAQTAFARSGEGEGVVVVHGVVPKDDQEDYINALMTACGLAGAMGACIATVDADDSADHSEGIARLRDFRKGQASPDCLEEVSWVRVVPMTGDEEASMKEATRAVMLFIDFLDVQFDFARDIEGFLQAQRGAAGMPDYSTN